MRDLDDKDAGAIDSDCYSLSGNVEDGNFEHIPVPAEIELALKPGKYGCVLFTTYWERGRV